jgi:hypothetical protein
VAAFDTVKKNEEDLREEVTMEQQIRNQMMTILIETQEKINMCIKHSALRAKPLPASKMLQIEYSNNDSVLSISSNHSKNFSSTLPSSMSESSIPNLSILETTTLQVSQPPKEASETDSEMIMAELDRFDPTTDQNTSAN